MSEERLGAVYTANGVTGFLNMEPVTTKDMPPSPSMESKESGWAQKAEQLFIEYQREHPDPDDFARGSIEAQGAMMYYLTKLVEEGKETRADLLHLLEISDHFSMSWHVATENIDEARRMIKEWQAIERKYREA